jgi:hypothetical protein
MAYWLLVEQLELPTAIQVSTGFPGQLVQQALEGASLKPMGNRLQSGSIVQTLFLGYSNDAENSKDIA